jgi:hypothetical protein
MDPVLYDREGSKQSEHTIVRERAEERESQAMVELLKSAKKKVS